MGEITFDSQDDHVAESHPADGISQSEFWCCTVAVRKVTTAMDKVIVNSQVACSIHLVSVSRLHVRFPALLFLGLQCHHPQKEKRLDRQATEIILVTRSDIPRVTSWPASAHGTEHEEGTEAKDATLAFLPSSPNSCLPSPGYLQQRSHTPCLFLSRLHGHTSMATKTKTLKKRSLKRITALVATGLTKVCIDVGSGTTDSGTLQLFKIF